MECRAISTVSQTGVRRPGAPARGGAVPQFPARQAAAALELQPLSHECRQQWRQQSHGAREDTQSLRHGVWLSAARHFDLTPPHASIPSAPCIAPSPASLLSIILSCNLHYKLACSTTDHHPSWRLTPVTLRSTTRQQRRAKRAPLRMLSSRDQPAVARRSMRPPSLR